jgi:transposase
VTDREQRGLVIAATCKIHRKGRVWICPSQSGKGKYTVSPDEAQPHCSCPDHEAWGHACKHIHAVRIVIQREMFDDGREVETRQVVLTEQRTTYPQPWRAYNAAQVNEKEQFQLLLHSLCKGLTMPQAVGRGRPRIPIADAIFAACFKVYSTVSGRRFMCDLRDANEKGYCRRLPCYNSIFNVFDDPATLPILKALVEESAAPLKALETSFACDSSGFSGSRFDRWYDHKFGDRRIMRSWCKVHAMVGVKTNIVTAIEIHDQNAGDPTQFPNLLATTAQRFNVNEVCADMAYSTKRILHLCNDLGATPLIPFKSTASDTGKDGLWNRMFHYFQYNRDAFLARYHQRSNVESTFSMIKAKFGDSVRSKCDTAMRNEVAAKVVCHNICCLISAMHEMGVDPIFWADRSSQKLAMNG